MNDISNSASDANAETLAGEGRKVRAFIASNRSDALLRLFDFLLQQSIEGRRPKETEIAEEIFRDGVAGSGGQGSRARVGIHRLRKKLDLYYADKPGARLVIPQGGYGFVIKLPEAPRNAEMPAENASKRMRFGTAIWLGASTLLLMNAILAWLHFGDAGGLPAPARSLLWQSMDGGKNPTVIALGDYFLFVSKQNDNGSEEVTQDLSIDSADKFYEYVTSTPGVRGKVRNEDLHAVSSDIVGSISDLWRYLKADRPVAVASSALDPDMMESSNIVYVGALDALSPLLSNPLFQASRFSCGTTCYELVDKPSGRRFLSDSPYLLDDGVIPRRDYGYIASYPGPSGNRILIVSGTGDAGVRQMVRIVTDPKRLEEVCKQIGGKFESFEALYHVRTMFNRTYSSSLVIARPINTERMWDMTQRIR